MSELPNCPKCGESYTYEDGPIFMYVLCVLTNGRPPMLKPPKVV